MQAVSTNLMKSHTQQRSASTVLIQLMQYDRHVEEVYAKQMGLSLQYFVESDLI
jgi:hypothetical protein